MSFTVIPVGPLKEFVQGQGQIVLPVSGATIRQVLEDLGLPSPFVGAVLANDVLVTKDYIPQEGDTIKLVPILGGG